MYLALTNQAAPWPLVTGSGIRTLPDLPRRNGTTEGTENTETARPQPSESESTTTETLSTEVGKQAHT